MTIHTQQSLSGLIASQPQLAFNTKGEARLWVRIGQEHADRNEDGTFTQTETTYHDLVMFRRNAERAYAMFNKGDVFIAEGYTHTATRERDGETVETEEFVAKRLGHDSVRTNYTLQRRRNDAGLLEGRNPGDAVGRPTATQAENARLKAQLRRAEKERDTAEAALTREPCQGRFASLRDAAVPHP